MFPFDLPPVSAAYITLYLVTLLMHVGFMSYVLAGAIMLGVRGLRALLSSQPRTTAWAAIFTVLKDWMPFALSAAITAGIAPLLFVQILYQEEFYTANLLSFHRFMAILPVLIIAFYLLYLLKAERIVGRTLLEGLVALAVMALIFFVGFSWVENHLLSLHREVWASQYQSEAMVFKTPAIFPRLGFWVTAAFPTAALLLSWQLHAGASGVSRDSAQKALRPLSLVAIAGTLLASGAAWPVLSGVLPSAAAASHASSLRVAMSILLIGSVLQLALWLSLLRRPTFSAKTLTGLSLGALLFWLGALLMREEARLGTLYRTALLARHLQVGTLSGLVVFLVFAVLGIGAISWIMRTVAKALRPNS
jgi:hypothetical protein